VLNIGNLSAKIRIAIIDMRCSVDMLIMPVLEIKNKMSLVVGVGDVSKLEMSSCRARARLSFFGNKSQ